jgi:hypothetical protein
LRVTIDPAQRTGVRIAYRAQRRGVTFDFNDNSGYAPRDVSSKLARTGAQRYIP